jgi:geranylgeranyl transferase type-2 subunit beta
MRLTMGAVTLPPEIRKRHIDYLLGQQKPDGGFGGREGGSDPYYTGFALRGLMMLGALDDQVAGRCAEFLTSRFQGRESIVDLISLVFGAAVLEVGAEIDVLSSAPPNWPEQLSELLETYRRDDGGYAKSPEGRAGSTYQTFLTLLCYELIGIPLPRRDEALQFLLDREHEEGGFLEIRVGKRAGVNPTAAAIGGLKVLDHLTPEIRQRTIDFMVDQQSDEGGFTANTRIPLADLLSTCTGMITLADLNAGDQVNRPAARRFVMSMERPTGGFAGFAFDPAEDVEYTFYGVSALALLSE